MKRKYLSLFLLLLVCTILSGCWDRRELQERLFVLAIGIDSVKAEVGKEKTFTQAYGDKRYKVSLQIMDVQPSAGEEGGRGKTKTDTYVISETGYSIGETLRAIIRQVNRNLWFDNVQAVVISQDVLQQDALTSIMDYLIREREFRTLIKVFVTSGEAIKILEYKPASGMPGGMFMENVMDLSVKNPHVEGQYMDINQYMRNKDNKEVTGFPRIELERDILKVKGLAVLNSQDKLLGYLDEYAVKGGNLIGGQLKSAIITFYCPEHPDSMIAVEFRSSQVKVTSLVKGEKVYYQMKSVIKGNVGEVQCAAAHNTMQGDYLQLLEGLAGEEIRRNVAYTFRNYQRIGWDRNLFSANLQRQHPSEWERLKDRWFSEVFPESRLEVDAQVHLEYVGNHK